MFVFIDIRDIDNYHSSCMKLKIVSISYSIVFSFFPQDGVTALLMASLNGHVEVVRLLLQSGAKDLPDKVNHITFVIGACTVYMHIYTRILLVQC